MRFRIGLIGATGYIARDYRQEIRDSADEAQIVAVCARRAERLQAAAEEDAAQLATKDWREVVEHSDVNFIEDFSFRGLGIDARYVPSRGSNYSFGFNFGWNVLNEKNDFGTERNTISLPNADISGTQLRYFNSVPLLANASYYFGDRGGIRPRDRPADRQGIQLPGEERGRLLRVSGQEGLHPNRRSGDRALGAHQFRGNLRRPAEVAR